MDPVHRRAARSVVVVFLLAVSLVACRPELVVKLNTRVYPDGSVDRQLRVDGRDDDGKAPETRDWLEKEAGLVLADPEAWNRVEEGPGWLRAEGFFPSADDLPPLLGHRIRGGSRPERLRTTLDIDDGVVLTRWTYVQSHGDLYDEGEIDLAVAALTDLAVKALRSELHGQFGDRIDPGPALERLREDVEPLARAMIQAGRRSPGWENVEHRVDQWSRILSQHGYSPAAPTEPEDYWDSQLPILLQELRQRVAGALTDSGRTMPAEELTFWPSVGDPMEGIETIVERVWGSSDAFQSEVEPHLATLSGYYGGDDGPSFRFDVRVEMPGTLLYTSGAPDGNAAIWLLRENDLAAGEQILRAESVELDDEALRRLSARREFEPDELVRLADLIWKRDRDDGLIELLKRSVDEGNLDSLRDSDMVPDELTLTARELAELLTP